jgi:hypothetical protein
MRVYYRSGETINRERAGETTDERRSPSGNPQYFVKWADGTSGWYLAQNLAFGLTGRGGAGRGQGRKADIVTAAHELAQRTARAANLKPLDVSQLAIAIASARAALTDLENEAARRSA